MKLLAKNKKAPFEYSLSNQLEVGMVLLGDEIKTIISSSIDLTGSYVQIKDNEVWLLNSTLSGMDFEKFMQKRDISKYPVMKSAYSEATRPRKLLLHKRQIQKFLKLSKDPGWTLLVTKVYLDENGRVKAEMALGKGKNQKDKRETIKKRDLERRGE